MSRPVSIWAKLLKLCKPTAIVVCGILSIGLIVLWVRSSTRNESYRWMTRNLMGDFAEVSSVSIASSSGGARVAHTRIYGSPPAVQVSMLRQDFRNLGYRLRGPSTLVRSTRDDYVLSSLGFDGLSRTDADPEQGRTISETSLTLPYWFLLLLTAGYPVSTYVRMVVHRQREERLASGLCPRCGEPVIEFHPKCRGCDLPAALLTEA